MARPGFPGRQSHVRPLRCTLLIAKKGHPADLN